MIPHTYSQWIAALDTLQDGTNDSVILTEMRQGTLEWQTGVAERFSKKLTDVINARMNRASDRFGREMSHTHSEGDIIRAILNLRREMCFLLQAIDLPVIPQELRTQYCDLVRKQADNMQKSLEDSAQKDRTGKMSSIVRNHKVNNF